MSELEKRKGPKGPLFFCYTLHLGRREGMKKLIATAANERIGGFLVNDWYKSLKENVKLDDTDVLVIDYGLGPWRNFLKDVILFSPVCTSGNLVNTRFINLAIFLEEHPEYDQVLFCDGGDLIFQDDVSHLFELKKNAFRMVLENESPPIDVVVKDEDLIDGEKIKRFLRDKRLFNAGFMVAPREKYLEIRDFMEKSVKNMNAWGVDMIVINYLAYRGEYVALDNKYNFIPPTAKKKFYVKNSKFYLENGELIPVVHNAGRFDIIRPVKNFGYGEGKNIVDPISVWLFRIIFRLSNLLKKLS